MGSYSLKKSRTSPGPPGGSGWPAGGGEEAAAGRKPAGGAEGGGHECYRVAGNGRHMGWSHGSHGQLPGLATNTFVPLLPESL